MVLQCSWSIEKLFLRKIEKENCNYCGSAAHSFLLQKPGKYLHNPSKEAEAWGEAASSLCKGSWSSVWTSCGVQVQLKHLDFLIMHMKFQPQCFTFKRCFSNSFLFIVNLNPRQECISISLESANHMTQVHIPFNAFSILQQHL